MAIYRHLSLCRRLRYLRERAKLTQEQVADHLEISQAAYARMEQGLVGLSIERIWKLADLYELTASGMIDGL
jgi:transcriptional regulator with XRE-family HTH domain